MTTQGAIVFLLVLHIATGAIQQSDQLTLIGDGGELFLQSTKKPETCTTEYSCSGCSDIIICRKTKTGFQKLTTITCKAPTPYCDYPTASCTAEAPLPCLPSDNFTCMMDGIFPDKTNCSRYHHCKDSISFPYSCGTGYFNAQKGECTPGPCYTFDCKGKHGVKTHHNGYTKYFTYCGDNFPVVVSMCDKGYIFNTPLQKCVPLCAGEGRILDISDCTKYFMCSATNVLSNIDCPFSYGFDPETLRCIPLAMLPFCDPKNRHK